MNHDEPKPKATATTFSRARGGVATGVRAGKAKTAEKQFQAMDAFIRG
ncbi:MAG: hypothetical protein U0324_01695 [Polyangiales bacterium]